MSLDRPEGELEQLQHGCSCSSRSDRDTGGREQSGPVDVDGSKNEGRRRSTSSGFFIPGHASSSSETTGSRLYRTTSAWVQNQRHLRETQQELSALQQRDLEEAIKAKEEYDAMQVRDLQTNAMRVPFLHLVCPLSLRKHTPSVTHPFSRPPIHLYFVHTHAGPAARVTEQPQSWQSDNAGKGSARKRGCGTRKNDRKHACTVSV